MGREGPGGRPAAPGTDNQLSGTVFGPSVQAGAIHGDVHVHESAAGVPVVPRQLLAPSPYFTNRSAELAALDAALESGVPLVVLTGAGGVGKTALATHWAQRVLDRFPDGQLQADLGGFDGTRPLDPGEVLGRFLRGLGVPGARIPASLAEQAALYRSVTAGRRMLVMLDNGYSAAQVRVLLPGSASAMVLVTSRARLTGLIPAGARIIEVGPLGTGDAVALLSRTLGAARVDGQRGRAEELARVCGGLPIALAVAAARLTSRPRMSLGRMVADLADEAHRLGGLSMPEGPSVQAAFDVSYRFLHPATAMLYRRLALHPGPEFGPGPAMALMPAIRAHHCGDTPPDTMDALVEASLLDEVDEQRFRFHDLLRLHARQKAEAQESPGDRDAALRAILEWYLAAAARADKVLTPYRRGLPYPFATAPECLPRHSGRTEALDWLDRERVNLIGAGRVAIDHGWAQLAWQLCDVLWPLFLNRKHYRDRMEVDRRGVAAARAWGDAWAEADMLKRLSRSCVTAGDPEAAERHIRAAIARFADAGDERGGLDAQEGLASLYRDTGRLELAVELFTQVLAANRARGEDRNLGLTLINLGMLSTRLGRIAEALRLLEEARDVFAGVSGIDPYNQNQVLIGLAAAHLAAGDLARAEREAEAAAERMRALGSEHERAQALDLLGQVAQRRGERELAYRHYRLALDILQGLGSVQAAEVRRHLAGVDDAGVPDGGGTAPSGAASS